MKITRDVIAAPGTGGLTDGVDNAVPTCTDDAESVQVILEVVRTGPGLKAPAPPATACTGEHHVAAAQRGPVY